MRSEVCNILHTVHCALYTVHCALYTVLCTLYTVHCKLFIALLAPMLPHHITPHCTLQCTALRCKALNCALVTVRCKLYNAHYSLSTELCTMHCALSTTLYTAHCSHAHCSLYMRTARVHMRRYPELELPGRGDEVCPDRGGTRHLQEGLGEAAVAVLLRCVRVCMCVRERRGGPGAQVRACVRGSASEWMSGWMSEREGE
jgi:hypothetical protein